MTPLTNFKIHSINLTIKLKSIYPDEWQTWIPNHARGAAELEAYPGNYLIYGSFSHYNDTIQPCIAVVNENGIIQDNFFQGQGATEHYPFDDTDDYIHPAVSVIEQVENGDLLVGGAFSEFMSETHHSVVKLKLGTVGVDKRNKKIELGLYPNPAFQILHISMPSGIITSGLIYDTVGKQVLNFSFNNNEALIDVSKLEPGIYFVKVQLENGRTGLRKFVKAR